MRRRGIDRTRGGSILTWLVGVAIVGVSPAPAHATPGWTVVARAAAPLLAGLTDRQGTATSPASLADPKSTPVLPTIPSPTGARPTQEQEQQRPEPPPVLDPASGAVFSVLGGSIWSGASAFQTGAAFAYFFGDKASFGFEVEGAVTFGPGGRVSQVMGSFVWQTGARTSKFVPFFAGGVGYLHATSEYPSDTQDVLDEFGIDPQPKTEQGPFVQYGGGLRYYLRPSISIRADVRFALVPLDLEVDPGFWDRLYGMRRIAGMLSWDF